MASLIHEQLWNEEDGFYYYRQSKPNASGLNHRVGSSSSTGFGSSDAHTNPNNGTFLPLMSIAGFWPMLLGDLGGGMPPGRVKVLLAHMTDPKHFGTAAPLPTVSRSDPTFSVDMFRGA